MRTNIRKSVSFAVVIGFAAPALTAAPAFAAAAGADMKCTEQMVKTIWPFKRHPNRTLEDFAEHYVHNHAVLGRNLTKSLKGYQVNIVQNPMGDDPNTLTEHWVPTDADGNAIWTYTTADEARMVSEDDQTMFPRGTTPYIVKKEVTVLAAPPLDSPMYEATPEFKTILLYPDATKVPAAPPAGARRVIDSYVAYRSAGKERAKPDVEVFRSVWSSKPIEVKGVKALVMKEYREIKVPMENWCSTSK